MNTAIVDESANGEHARPADCLIGTRAGIGRRPAQNQRSTRGRRDRRVDQSPLIAFIWPEEGESWPYPSCRTMIGLVWVPWVTRRAPRVPAAPRSRSATPRAAEGAPRRHRRRHRRHAPADPPDPAVIRQVSSLCPGGLFRRRSRLLGLLAVRLTPQEVAAKVAVAQVGVPAVAAAIVRYPRHAPLPLAAGAMGAVVRQVPRIRPGGLVRPLSFLPGGLAIFTTNSLGLGAATAVVVAAALEAIHRHPAAPRGRAAAHHSSIRPGHRPPSQ